MKTLYKNGSWWEDASITNMLVEGGIVLYRGMETPVADKVVDLYGKTVMPGFFDCHMHVLNAGLDLNVLNLRECNSREEIAQAVSQKSREIEDGQWLLAVHYDANRIADARDVTAQELDRWSGGKPVVLRQASGHSCVASATALKIAGITSDTKDPAGGRIARGEFGEPVGLLEENAMTLVYGAMPKPNREQMVNAIREAAKSLREYGITATCDMSTGQYDLADELWAYQNANVDLRIGLYVLWSKVFNEDGARKPIEFPESDKLRVSGIKLFSDGAIGPATAAIYGEYETGGDGILIYEPEDLKRRVKIAADAGFRVAVHAVGDRAVDVVLDAFEGTQKPSMHRIEHAMILSDEQIQRIRKLDVAVTMQPEFLSEYGHAYFRRLGKARASKLKRLRSLVDAGVRVALSSDRPIVSGDPWKGIEAATNRPEGFDENENISRNEAIELYTSAGAEIDGWSFGSLLPGQFADLTIVN